MQQRIFFLSLTQILFSYQAFASVRDSILINEIKKVILNQVGFKVNEAFYTSWSESEKPYIILLVSPADRVDVVSMMQYGFNETAAKKAADEYSSLGHHTFIYRTYASSNTQLNTRFLSYSAESKCFIILHEFIHHYIRDNKLAIPFEYEEALGDIVGNYGAIEFMKGSNYLNQRQLNIQKSWNENIYRRINKTINRINSGKGNIRKLNRKCQKRIEDVVKLGDSFLTDRFAYEVNNAYLLKNKYYSEKYFLLKKIVKKNGSILGLLKIIKNGPTESKSFEMYLKGFL